jgi:aminoglycoside phosphotransferase (APT) family kinase protein
MPELKDPPFATGAQAEFYAWKDGQALKLLRERVPLARECEVAAGRIASAAGLPVPAVIDGLIEVDDREGIVFERVNGPTMTRYVEDHPGSAIECASQMANLHVEIHQREVPESLELSYLLDHHFRLTLFILQADGLSPDIRNAVLGILDRLPRVTTLCHGDFHPENIIMAPDGPVAIDWSNGARGTPMTDFARTWLLFRLMTETNPESMTQIDTFWQTYSSRYRELSSCPEDELVNWQIVQAAASLFQDRQSYDSMPAVIETRIDFVHAMLGGGTHRWKT